MLVILPKTMVWRNLRALSVEILSELRGALKPQRVMVYFPKFAMRTRYSLPQSLSKMGIPSAFTGAADFSGMDGTGDLYIDDIIHQAFVEVNEKGTESAAMIVIVLLSVKPLDEDVPVFRVDCPFIFFIQESETGDILLMGRVSDPSG